MTAMKPVGPTETGRGINIEALQKQRISKAKSVPIQKWKDKSAGDKVLVVVSNKLLTPSHSPRLLNHKKDAKQESPQGYIVWNV
jgi:hypothetical protein